MAKKSKKKGSSNCSQNISARDESIVSEEVSACQSINEETKTTKKFMIMLDHKNSYSKLLKSSDVILLHPSIIQKFQAPTHILVEGKHCYALCVPFYLKDIKRSTVVFRKDITAFKNEEFVTLHPYTKCVLNAKSVAVSFNADIVLDEDVKEQILRILRRKRYFYTGMLIKEGSFDFAITDILGSKSDAISDNESFNISHFRNISASFHNSSDISFTETTHRKLLSSSAYDKSRNFDADKSSRLNSMFSSMCLNDSMPEISDSFNQSSVADAESFSQTNVPNVFYTLNHRTSITVNRDSFNSEKRALPCFQHIGGLNTELEFVKNFIEKFFNSEMRKEVLLLTGPPGTGKTLILDAIKNTYEVYTEEILWHSLYLKTVSDAERELRQLFQRANQRSPCIIIMDDFNYLCPKIKDLQSQRFSRLMSHLLENSAGENTVVLAASNNSEYDVKVFQSGETRIEELKFRIPTSDEREDIFEKLLSNKQHNLIPEEIKQCVLHSQGFTGRDLNFVINEAFSIHCMNRHKNQSSYKDVNYGIITFDDIKQSLKYKKPSIMESNMKIKEVRWSDIGGMREVKEKLKDIVEGPLKYPEIYKRFGITPSKGVLLFGPPGCSKTMIAKAMATECNMNFISKNVSDIQNKYVGESEKAVRDLFLLARQKAPCIIFLDEIDALVAGRGSSSESGVEERIVNSFLQEMDGLEELQNVIIIAATNRPDRLDTAFVRNGRINHFIYIPLPDYEAREEILRLQMRNRTVSDDFDYKQLASKTEGYSGAEIVNICNEAAFQILLDDTNCETAVFTMEHFDNAMKILIPRTPSDLLEFYKDYNARFGS